MAALWANAEGVFGVDFLPPDERYVKTPITSNIHTSTVYRTPELDGSGHI